MKQLHQTNKPFSREKSQKAQKGNAFFFAPFVTLCGYSFFPLSVAAAPRCVLCVTV
jgi:hypothetical protein